MNAIRWLSHSPKNRPLAQVKPIQDVASWLIAAPVIAVLAVATWSAVIALIIAIRSLI